MLADCPIIEYEREEKKKGFGASAKDVAEMDELSEAWAKKNGKGAAGEHVSLSEYLKTKT